MKKLPESKESEPAYRVVWLFLRGRRRLLALITGSQPS